MFSECEVDEEKSISCIEAFKRYLYLMKGFVPDNYSEPLGSGRIVIEGYTAENEADNSTSKGTQSMQTHKCEVDGCQNDGRHSMIGFSGTTEWYCDEHYQEMEDILDMMIDDVYSGNQGAGSSEDSLSGGVSASIVSYDATLRYGNGSILICSSEDAMDKYMIALANGNQGTLDEMAANGEIAYTAKDTKCNIVNRKLTKCQVKLLDGIYAGNIVWVVIEAVQEK